MAEDSVTRFVATYINKDGMRTLMDSMQGRYTYEKREEAQARLDALLMNNPVTRIASIWGQQAIGTFEVRPVKCWPGHFDPQTCYFD